MADTPDEQPRSDPSFGPADPRIVRKAASRSGSYDEIGRSGLRHWGGFLHEEWLRTLQGRRGAEFYREMSDQDPVLGGIIYCIEMLVRKADWWVEPASEDKPDVDAQVFYEQVLFEDMENSWDDVVSEAMSMLVYGWSWGELVWKQRGGDVKDPTRKSKFTDGKIGLRKIAFRGQDSLWRWEFADDSDDLVGMTQQAPPTYMEYTIPVEKSLHFRTRMHKQNPEGRSLFRNAVRNYYLKRETENIEGVGIERDLAGLPVLTPPPDVDIWNQSDPNMATTLAQAQRLVSSIRRDEQEGIIKPHGWELELLSTGGRRQFDTSAIITRHDHRMAASVLADLLLLGQDKVGSYALSATKEDLFAASIDAYLDIVATVFDNQLAPRLFKLNAFPGLTGLPKLKHGNVQGVDLESVSNFVQKLGMSGAPIWPNPELLEKLFELAGLPAPPDDTDEMLGGAVPAEPKPKTPAGAADAADPASLDE